MAKLWFASPEGGERPYTLDRYRTLRIGRDPGNDIVLRDPRVSRQHAEITFQRGFFVLHDLASANGSFVNGKKIRVAPLINGAELRIGNTAGRFTDDAPNDDGGSGTLAVPQARREDFTALEEERPESPSPGEGAGDMGAERVAAEKHVPTAPAPLWIPLPTLIDSEPVSVQQEEVAPDDVESRIAASARQPPDDSKFFRSSFAIEAVDAGRETGVIRGEEGEPLFYYRRPIHLVGCMAGVVGGLVITAGAAAVAVLALLHSFVAAAAAAALTLAFTALIFLLVPRRDIALYEEAGMNTLALRILQESRWTFPSLRFGVTDPGGTPVGSLQRSALSRIARHRWVLLDGRTGSRLGYAVQSSLPRALLQNFVGTLFGALRTGFRIYARGKPVGAIGRPPGTRSRSVIDLSSDPGMVLDRRLALALAVVIDTVEFR